MLAYLIIASLGWLQDDRTQQIEYIRSSYRANKDVFQFGSFRFEFTSGSSQSLSDAQANLYIHSYSEPGYYVFDGKNARYELIADPSVIAAATKKIDDRRAVSSLSSFRMTTDGKATMYERLILNGAQSALIHQGAMILPGTDRFSKSLKFPLNLGDEKPHPYDLFTQLSLVKDGKVSLIEFDPDARLDGLSVCKLAFTYNKGTINYWIDLKRGSLPLRILDHFSPSNLDVNLYYSDLVQASNGGWLPRRMLHVVGNGGTVYRVVVKEIDTQHRPPSTAFQLDFPEPVQMHDSVKKVIYSPRKAWSLLDLPGAKSPGTRPAIPKTYVPPEDLPGEVESSFPWAVIVPSGIVLLAIVVGSIAFLARRRLSAKRV